MGSNAWGSVLVPSTDSVDDTVSKACGVEGSSSTASSPESSSTQASTTQETKETGVTLISSTATASPTSTSSESSAGPTSSAAETSSSPSSAPAPPSSSDSAPVGNVAILSTSSSSDFAPTISSSEPATSSTPEPSTSSFTPEPTTSSAPETTSSSTPEPEPTTTSSSSENQPPSTSSSASSNQPSVQSFVSGGGAWTGTQDDINQYLSAHNSFRAQHGAVDLTWNQDLANAAQQWANGCVFQHSGGSLGPFGENLAAGTGDGYTIQSAIDSWTGESGDYDPNNPQPSHFTQVVWKASTEVGCAFQMCDGIFDPSFGQAKNVVCEYKSQGNVIGQFPQNVQA